MNINLIIGIIVFIDCFWVVKKIIIIGEIIFINIKVKFIWLIILLYFFI